MLKHWELFWIKSFAQHPVVLTLPLFLILDPVTVFKYGVGLDLGDDIHAAEERIPATSGH